ncbi:MAG: hypothetical protein V1776_04230 [Candidatus Diapherotrites archaeon]
MMWQVSMGDSVLPIIIGLVWLVVILYFAFYRKPKQTPQQAMGSSSLQVYPNENNKESMTQPIPKVSLEPANPIPFPRTSSTLETPPVQRVMQQNQVWEEKATQPDPFSGKPQTEVQAKAQQVLLLLPYIRQYRSQGYNDQNISELLARNGWPDNLIRIALDQA